jgi:hypothetical protein
LKNRIITILALLGICAYLLIEAEGRGDFFIYLSASHDLFRGKDIYSELYAQWYHYYYSLFFAILIYPLNYLPYYPAKVLWLAFNAFFLYRIIRIIMSFFDVTSLTMKQKYILLALCMLVGLRFILNNFHLSQATILILYLSLEGVKQIDSGNKIAGAFFIAFAINIKLLGLVLLPYLVYRNEIKAFASVILFYTMMLFIPVLVIGVDRNVALLGSWWELVNPMNTKNILDVDETSFHSLSTLLATLLVAHVPDSHALPIRRNIADMSVTQLTYILNTVRLMLILFSLYFFRTMPFRPAKNRLHRYWEVSYLLLLVPLIFPHQQCYAFLFIVPAECYVLYYLFVNRNLMTAARFKLITGAMVVIYLLGNLSLLLGEFQEYYDHFKIVTYGALSLIPVLAICKPNLEKEQLRA